MKLFKIARNIYRNTKFSKKETALNILWFVFNSSIERLRRSSRILDVVLRYLSVFRKWFFHMSLFSLFYGLISEIFTLKYDYRFFVSISYGCFLLVTELISEFSENIFDYWYKFINKLSNKVESHSSDDNKIINHKSVEQIKQLAEDNRSFRGEPHSESLKRTYVHSNEDEYNMLNDWRVWAAAAVITIATVTAIHYYGPEYSTLKESAKSLYDKMKAYFLGDSDDGDSSASTESSRPNHSNGNVTPVPGAMEELKAELQRLDEVRKVKGKDIPAPEPAKETEVWRSNAPYPQSEFDRYFKPVENEASSSSSSASSSGTITPTSSSSGSATPKANSSSLSTDEPSKIVSVSEHFWNFDNYNDYEQREFYDELTSTLGQLVHFNKQIQRMLENNKFLKWGKRRKSFRLEFFIVIVPLFYITMYNNIVNINKTI